MWDNKQPELDTEKFWLTVIVAGVFSAFVFDKWELFMQLWIVIIVFLVNVTPNFFVRK